jgi:putative transposase
MPRQARLDAPGLVHHVMARGIEDQKIFRDDKDREDFLIRLTESLELSGGARLYAWALTSNHFHLLLRTDEHMLSPIMRRLMTGHAVSYNRRYRRKGHLFQNRFKSIIVEEEPYFLELVRYIHLNPARVGIVNTIEALAEYPYTGHSVILGSREFPVQDTGAVLERFSAKAPKAKTEYESFIVAGFTQGTREELRGGGLIRSMGGLGKFLLRDSEHREAADERILGGGDFVESVLGNCEPVKASETVMIFQILAEVAGRTGVAADEILGPSRCHIISKARREFYLCAHERIGASLAALGKLTGRTHVAVLLAIEEARKERKWL